MNTPPRPPPHGPPPPPHGEMPNRGGLPNGHYDIFIVPSHQAGGGFVYWPSFNLRPSPNAIIAGILSGTVFTLIWQTVYPVFQAWFMSVMRSGGTGVIMLLLVVGVGSWLLARLPSKSGTQAEGSAGSSGTDSSRAPPGGMPGTSYGSPPAANRTTPPKFSWQRTNPRPTYPGGFASGTAGRGTSRAVWAMAGEKTGEEVEDGRPDEVRGEMEGAEEEVRETQRKKVEIQNEAKKEQEQARTAEPPKANKPTLKRSPSPIQNHQQQGAATTADNDAPFFPPDDKVKRPAHKTISASSIYSKSSYAPSQSAAKTLPPSHRANCRTKNSNKIVLKAVYSFNHTFASLPVAQLI